MSLSMAPISMHNYTDVPVLGVYCSSATVPGGTCNATLGMPAAKVSLGLLVGIFITTPPLCSCPRAAADGGTTTGIAGTFAGAAWGAEELVHTVAEGRAA